MLKYDNGYSPVVNEEKMTALSEQTIIQLFGEEKVHYGEPVMGSEDFSAFSEVVPGSFLFLGAGDTDTEKNFPHHHPKFEIKEEALELGVMYFIKMGLTFGKQ